MMLPNNWKTLLVLIYLGGTQLWDVIIALTKGVLHPNLLIVAVGIFLLHLDGVFSQIKIPNMKKDK